MKPMRTKACTLSTFWGLLVLCSCATEHAVHRRLPGEVTLNQDAGRGNGILVTVQLEGGQKLPCLVDTGTSVTIFDKSLEPRLGKRLDETTAPTFAGEAKVGVYPAPKLYLGRTQLVTGLSYVFSADFKQELPKPVPSFKAILGMDVLMHYCIQLDFEAGKMRFLEEKGADTKSWGKEFALFFAGAVPLVQENLLGAKEGASLIDTGYLGDGWMKPKLFQQWTNHAQLPPEGERRAPNGVLGGEAYPGLELEEHSWGPGLNGIGLAVLARNLVTLDFPKQRMYLKRTSPGDLPDRATEAELKPAALAAEHVLLSLKKEGRLPGFPIGGKRHGSMMIYFDSPLSITADVAADGATDVYHYRLVQASKGGPWKLRKAWRTDLNGRLLEEYPVP
jgi:hypothetical protein